MKSLVWLRNDLRMDDNPALKHACLNSDEVHCLYLYQPDQMKLHNVASCKIEFIIENLKDLESSLSKINVPLTVITSKCFDDCPNLIIDVINKRSIKKVYWNNQFGFDEQRRDSAVKDVLDRNNIYNESFDDQVIYPPGTIRTMEGKPYSVFTPFKRRWIENFNILSFIINFFSIYKDRNDPILEGTSRISPYLASGVISSRRCILEALKRNDFKLDSGEKGVVKWIDEIVWREFYKNIMFSFPKVSKGRPFQDYTKNINWRFNEDEFEAWKNGKTGFPIIDSAMRQLKHEGWMHNRLRMVVAMFFTKNMLHDWRLGEAFFMQNLIDGDFSSNNGGWQWSSSTGTDAAPYFRIFNPITQSKNFDSDGIFIKKHIFELRDLDKKEIHDPSSKIREHCKYPSPILDLKSSRLRAIDAFSEAKN